jgi:hypothetical protein
MIGRSLAKIFDDSFFPANKEEIIEYAIREGAGPDVIRHLEDLEDDAFASFADLLPDEDFSDFHSNDEL